MAETLNKVHSSKKYIFIHNGIIFILAKCVQSTPDNIDKELDSRRSIVTLPVILTMINFTVDLRIICKELGQVEHQSFKIGVILGVPYHVLNSQTNADPLSKVINCWLRGNTKTPVSWRTIVEGLESSYISEKGLAREILKKLNTGELP